MIRKDGYYISGGKPWVDWHAGHKFEGVIYYLFRFIDDHKVLSPSSKTKDIDMQIFSEREIEYIDEYKLLDDYTLEIIFNPQSKWPIRKTYTILSPEVLLDEDMNEYTFTFFSI